MFAKIGFANFAMHLTVVTASTAKIQDWRISVFKGIKSFPITQ